MYRDQCTGGVGGGAKGKALLFYHFIIIFHCEYTILLLFSSYFITCSYLHDLPNNAIAKMMGKRQGDNKNDKK